MKILLSGGALIRVWAFIRSFTVLHLLSKVFSITKSLESCDSNLKFKVSKASSIYTQDLVNNSSFMAINSGIQSSLAA